MNDLDQLRMRYDDLKKKEAREKAFLENAAEGVIIIDSFGTIKEFNLAAQRLFGYTREEIIGQNVILLMPSHYHEKHDGYLAIYRNTGKADLSSKNLELTGKRKDGSLFLLESTANDFYDGFEMLFISIIRDITERKEAEKELRLWAKVFETALSGVVITDMKGTILSVSHSFSETTGYKADEVIGKNPNILQSGRHNREFYSNMWASIIESGHWEGEIWNKRKNGETYPEWLSISSIKDNDGMVTNYVGIFRDITADIQIRQEVIRAGKIQQNSLPRDMENEFMQMKSIFQPLNYVSGDYYDYLWDSNNLIFHGVLLDVMGHGLSTALQISALRVLFRQATEKMLPLHERVKIINQEGQAYFDEGSFAAAIFFDLDFKNKELIICSAGISYIVHLNNHESAVIAVPGLFLGISNDEQYDQIVLPLNSEDAYFFMTDGLFDMLHDDELNEYLNFTDKFNSFKDLISNLLLIDDVTLLGIKIKAIHGF